MERFIVKILETVEIKFSGSQKFPRCSRLEQFPREELMARVCFILSVAHQDTLFSLLHS